MQELKDTLQVQALRSDTTSHPNPQESHSQSELYSILNKFNFQTSSMTREQLITFTHFGKPVDRCRHSYTLDSSVSIQNVSNAIGLQVPCQRPEVIKMGESDLVQTPPLLDSHTNT